MSEAGLHRWERLPLPIVPWRRSAVDLVVSLVERDRYDRNRPRDCSGPGRPPFVVHGADEAICRGHM